MGRTTGPAPARSGWLGDRNSWRRVVLAGLAGGLALALIAALTSNVCSGGSGSLDDEEPTAVVPAPGIPIDTEPPIEEFTPAPTVVLEPTPEPTATELLPEPSPTSTEPTEVVPEPTVEVTPVATP